MMITYVINTSENKTLDSNQLFKLGGYTRIRWMNYGLNELEKCADEICERQMVLGAEDFRISILVDFYGFDRIRSVYGAQGYSPIESGVDLSIYFPLLEAYMVDHLFSKIQAKELFVREKHVFYIQEDKNDGFNVLDNEEEQLQCILEPDETSVTEVINVKVARSEWESKRREQKEKEEYERELTEQERQAVISEYDEKIKELADLSDEDLIDRQRKINEKLQLELENEELQEAMHEEVYVDVPNKRYSCFQLYCTESLSLDFQLTDYPYTNQKGLSFHEFYLAFKQRESQYNGITRYHYYASFGSGAAKAAFDNLSLSLFLIKLYERDEPIKDRSDFVIDSIEPERLKRMLITAWNKICSAKTIALNNSSKYYDIKSLAVDKKVDYTERAHSEKAFSATESKSKARKDLRKLSPEEIYFEIGKITSESSDSFSDKDIKDLDKLMAKYLEKRDDTKESSTDYEFREIKDICKMTSQCPSKNDYENVIQKKKEAISNLLAKTINIEYISKEYVDQKKIAKTAYDDYVSAKSSLGKNMFGDVIVWLMSLFILLVPFMAIMGVSFEAISIYLISAAVYTGLYILASMIRTIPILNRLNDAKRRLKSCYLDCRVKQDIAMLNYKSRYENELINIENLRYELRNITRLYKYNLAKNRNIEEHRKMLEIVENKLSAMLNNLGVEPIVVRYKNLEEEFDVNKSFMSNDNKIYKIFSIDTIEGLFGGKER